MNEIFVTFADKEYNEKAMATTLRIKNMVCPRCILVIRQELERMGLHPHSIELGTVLVDETIDDLLRQRIRHALEPLGFELLNDPRTQLVEQMKDAIIRRVHYTDEPGRDTLSDFLTGYFHRDYSTLSKLFSEVTGTTLEKFAIAQKIERAKELLTYNELTLNEIADRLGYSSAAYLSAQFKQVTGQTPGAFKKNTAIRRKSLDAV